MLCCTYSRTKEGLLGGAGGGVIPVMGREDESNQDDHRTGVQLDWRDIKRKGPNTT